MFPFQEAFYDWWLGHLFTPSSPPIVTPLLLLCENMKLFWEWDFSFKHENLWKILFDAIKNARYKYIYYQLKNTNIIKNKKLNLNKVCINLSQGGKSQFSVTDLIHFHSMRRLSQRFQLEKFVGRSLHLITRKSEFKNSTIPNFCIYIGLATQL